jgi:glycosyltransferase involved in cell wall biosynthesis
MTTWHLLTGEYPPQPGGVADYSWLVASGLAQAGHDVHVWTTEPTVNGPTPEAPGVTVHRTCGSWSRPDLTRLSASLDAHPQPRRLLVQYTPNAWGHKGINIPFCRWLLLRRHLGDDIWTMVHEPFYPWRLFDKPTRWVLAVLHRLMMFDVIRASRRMFVSTSTLIGRLRPFEWGRRRPMTAIPVPSNIPTLSQTDPALVAERRHSLAPGGETLIGHFGTFGSHTDAEMNVLIRDLLATGQNRKIVLVGRNSVKFAASHPEWSGRVIATGGLDGFGVAYTLQACDILVQPYTDGVSTRRGSMMAGVSQGCPIVTVRSFNTEPIWAESGAVALVDSVHEMVPVVESLLADDNARTQLGRAAYALYERSFAIERTIETLLAQDAESADQPLK